MLYRYATATGDDGTLEDYEKIARFYEAKNMPAKAGHFFRKCHDYARAINLFLKCVHNPSKLAIYP